MAKKRPGNGEIEGHGSLLTWKGTDECLGSLLHADGHGTFDPTYGRVDVSKEDADAHNKALDEAMLKGLDENCEVGQGGCFYYHAVANSPGVVTTFLGTVVAPVHEKTTRVIRFIRANKVYRGVLRPTMDLFSFKRVK